MSRFGFLFVFLALLGLVALSPVSAQCTGSQGIQDETCFVLELEVISSGGQQATASVTITFSDLGSSQGVVTGATICSLAATSYVEWGNSQTTTGGVTTPAFGFDTNFPQPITLVSGTVSTLLDGGGKLFVSSLTLNFQLTANQGGGNGDHYTGALTVANPAGNTNGAAGTTTTLALTDTTHTTGGASFSGNGPTQESCAAVIGDPQFVGLRGQSFQVHGIDGAVYSLVSEKNTQVNSRFIFLTEGKCPIIDGVPQDDCWSHPGSYLGEMSFQQVVDGKLHAALLVAGPAKTGFAGVQMDGKLVKVGESVLFGSFSLSYDNAYEVNIATEHFRFRLSNSDMFINQAVQATVPLSKLDAHGLLGQTHSATLHKSTLKYIEGEVDDYVVDTGDIFGSSEVYNKFHV